jgi:transcriptional regulator with XRE-family HTH domain
MDQVAERLAELRERRALTLRELAEMSNVAADTINQIELGHRKARPSTLRKLARALEIDVQEFYAEPTVPLGEAPGETGLQEEQSSEAPSQPQLETEAEEERRIFPQSAESLKRYIEDLKELKELRETEMVEIGKGMGPGSARLLQMDMADKGLRDLLEELGVLAFAEGVRAGRELADPKAIPLSHELLRRLAELEALSAEARASSAAASSYIYEEGVKGMSEIERRAQEGTLEQRGTES